MHRSIILNKKPVLLVAIIIFAVLAVTFQVAVAAVSGCVTCHLDQEMLKKNITAQTGTKSALQSGSG